MPANNPLHYTPWHARAPVLASTLTHVCVSCAVRALALCAITHAAAWLTHTTLLMLPCCSVVSEPVIRLGRAGGAGTVQVAGCTGATGGRLRTRCVNPALVSACGDARRVCMHAADAVLHKRVCTDVHLYMHAQLPHYCTFWSPTVM